MKKDNGKKLVVLMLSQAFLMGHSKAGKPNYLQMLCVDTLNMRYSYRMEAVLL